MKMSLRPMKLKLKLVFRAPHTLGTGRKPSTINASKCNYSTVLVEAPCVLGDIGIYTELIEEPLPTFVARVTTVARQPLAPSHARQPPEQLQWGRESWWGRRAWRDGGHGCTAPQSAQDASSRHCRTVSRRPRVRNASGQGLQSQFGGTTGTEGFNDQQHVAAKK